MDSDKYPPEDGRRRFVKGVVGSATLASVGTGATAVLNSATSVAGGTGGPTDYVGIENTDGPAPRGMPLVPLTIDDEGYLKGVWPEVKERELKDGSTVTITEQDIGGVTYTGRWFQYCGVQSAQGLRPDADQDNFLRSKPGLYEWQADHEPGQKLHVDDFADYEEWSNDIGSAGAGKPAQTTWRSQSEGEQDVQELPVQVLRSPKVSDLPSKGDAPDFLRAATESDFIAWLDKCTHFCCTPGFNSSKDAAKFDATDAVYCQCHQSVYDPFSPVELSFNAFPRPG
ncbi:ubiquinol-cytochrome c reductase iron-sulfur subunit [Halorussus sp. MSC15.2]|uniref:ubiquinol-cytochrome c reductase iron-sulfur subunit n=1 Tax=Halorussus sp. MSC15.2 TaxID=2283638 RepID=UPI0013D3ED39|nr:ubiquinol-cytochrome c reductase iron-sulfur subunit [Halorussus sp. MSC15.2]NEU55971.1 ubiquinol-cytochrome c reductase iron-sulfur subunit [Halorussus sp. MSC15.2]